MARKIARIKIKYLIPICIILYFLLDDFGAFLHIFEKDFSNFEYPLEGDILKWIGQLQNGEKPDVDPVNPHNYHLIRQAKGKCVQYDGVHYEKLRLVYLVKSARKNFEKRAAIRKSWGFERRFSDVLIKVVFLLGSGNDSQENKDIENEYQEFGDIVQGDFIDSYYNNTLKTMMGLRWAMEQCPSSRFYFFVDDDYYVSTRNMLRFLRNPVNYPKYLEDPVISFDDEEIEKGRNQGRKLTQMIDFDVPEDIKLFAGYVMQTPPLRHKSSKWFVDLDEYPYDLWPPYVTAGAFILSKEALNDIYYGSYFVKKFRFDDIYLAIVAKKVGLEPFNCDEFHFVRPYYQRPRDFQYVIASHGFSNHAEMEKFWNVQRSAGNA